MAQCRFQFEFTGTAEGLVEKIRSHVGRAGGQLAGSASEGTYSLDTPVGAFQGTYTIVGQTIVLEVLSKPFFVPCAAIESRLSSYVRGVL